MADEETPERAEVVINYAIPAALHSRAKAAAARKGQTLKAWHRFALEEVVERQEAEHDEDQRRRGAR